ncbi:hypothetical protein MRX96_001570 [Rhipicephalus microplus]
MTVSRGLEKLGEAGICVAAVTTLLTRHRERHKYIIPLPLPDDIDGREDRVCKVRRQRQLDMEGLEKLGEAGICVATVTTLLTRHRERHKYIIPLPLPDDINGREDRVCKVRLQRQLDMEVSAACRSKLGRHGRYGAAIPTSLARHREWYKYKVPTLPPDENDWPEDCVWELRLQKQLVMKVSEA